MVTAQGVTIRSVEREDHAACEVLESCCFPAEEAASSENIAIRIERFPEGFLVAEKGGVVVGHINGGATNKDDITDEAFKGLVGHVPDGANAVVFSLAVTDALRGKGVGGALLEEYKRRMAEQGRRSVLLLCKEHLRGFYARHGFLDRGISASTHGGAVWHEMACPLEF